VVAVPLGVVTEIVTAPARWDLVVALMVVGLVTWRVAAVVEPNLTLVAPVRLVPRMVTVAPPLVLPVVRVNEVMVGGPMKVNSLLVPDVAVPPTVVTCTLTEPADCALVLAVMVVEFVTWRVAAVVEPNLTLVAPVKLVPVMTTVVPPVYGPEVGASDVMVGAATKVYS
jgi:hypothetical protein